MQKIHDEQNVKILSKKRIQLYMQDPEGESWPCHLA